MNTLTNRLLVAIMSSIALVGILILFVLSAAQETRNDIVMIILLPLALISATASAIISWVRYFKGYVDFAIEKKLRDTKKETKNESAKICDLEKL